MTQNLIESAGSDEQVVFLKHWLEGWYEFPKSHVEIGAEHRFKLMEKL